jgi:hypothetical protein
VTIDGKRRVRLVTFEDRIHDAPRTGRIRILQLALAVHGRKTRRDEQRVSFAKRNAEPFCKVQQPFPCSAPLALIR